MRIALVEDDPDQAALVARRVAGAGHECTHHETGGSLLSRGLVPPPDVILLDRGLPDLSGDEVLARLRAEHRWTGVVICVTARDRDAEILEALRAGADDYLCKPVAAPLLLGRLAAYAPPDRADDGAPLERPPFRIDPARRTVERDGEPVALEPGEWELAAALFRHPGRLVARARLVEPRLPPGASARDRAEMVRIVDRDVGRLRNRLRLGTATGWRLTREFGYGYRLERATERAAPARGGRVADGP